MLEVDNLGIALGKTRRIDSRKVRVVEMRHFGGLTMEEIADVPKIHVKTVLRDWTAARAWLRAAPTGEEMDAI
jgi:RNA polymerase sigma-70 factor, ECF subfamily